MTTTADNSWMPSGRHPVILGPSFTRTLKARQSGPIKNTKVKAEREFYSFRYNFKPESIDVTRSGTIETRKPKEEGGPSTVTVVRPSQQNDSGISFVGTENVAKEFECVLVYDEGTGTITLEKVDSYITLNHDPKPTLPPRHAASPAPAAPPRVSASSSASGSHAHQSVVKKEEEESEGEIPETKPEPKPEPKAKTRPTPVPKMMKSRPQPPTATAPASIPASASASASASTAATPAPTASANSRPAHGLPPRPTPVVPPKLKGKAPAASSQTPSIPAKSPNKRERPVDPEEETLEIRRPQPVLKRPKVVKKEVPQQPPPPPPKAVELSFPDSSSAVSLPPASLSAPVAPDPITSAATSSIVPSDSDDGWEDLVPPVATPASPVPLAAAAAPPPPPPPPPISSGPSHAIFMEEIEEFSPLPREVEQPTIPMAVDEADAEGEEDDMMAMFEKELNDELLGGMEQDEDDDFLAGAVSPVQERQPMSMSQYASGVADFGDDDEYSSSDDSDDD